jgi:hypothetical protein
LLLNKEGWDILKRKIVGLILGCILLFTANSSCFAAKAFTPTPLRGQERSYWCWAASDQMLLETQQIILSQTLVATLGSPPTTLFSGATRQQTYDHLAGHAPHLTWNNNTGYYAFSRIQSSINTGWALLGLLSKSSGGHAMVITGYDQNPAGYNNVWLQDPWGMSFTTFTGGIEGWVNYSAPIAGNYANSIFAGSPFTGYAWNVTMN